MIKPYYITSIQPKFNQWQDSVDFNKTTQQMVYDKGCKLLHNDTISFFENLGLIPLWGFIWSWTSDQVCSYHVDKSTTTANGVYGAMNILLQGDSAKLEWADCDKFSHAEDTVNKTSFVKYFGEVTPDYTTSLTTEYMTLVNVSIPHRINTSTIREKRWSYSMRFCIENLSPSWEDLRDKLKFYILD